MEPKGCNVLLSKASTIMPHIIRETSLQGGRCHERNLYHNRNWQPLRRHLMDHAFCETMSAMGKMPRKNSKTSYCPGVAVENFDLTGTELH